MSTIAQTSSPERVPAPGPAASTALVPVTPAAPAGMVTVAALSPPPPLPALTVEDVLAHVQLVRAVLARTMVEGVDYGRIPGCGDRPVLLKSGAERLCLTFRLAPAFAIEERHLERGHREVRVVCTLSTMGSGALVGQGVGAASTLESRHQRQSPGESTGRPVPRAYWDVRQEDPAKAQELLGGRCFSARKLEGQGWMICKGGGEKQEHDNPADLYNTTLKMGKKRALVDAVLSATAASSLFGQDLEEGRSGGGCAVADLVPPVVAKRAPTSSAREPRGDVVEASEEGAEGDKQDALGVDWRKVEVHFGKNRGRKLADLCDAEVAWYQDRWLPRREAAGPLAGGDAAFAIGLRAQNGRFRAPWRRFYAVKLRPCRLRLPQVKKAAGGGKVNVEIVHGRAREARGFGRSPPVS